MYLASQTEDEGHSGHNHGHPGSSLPQGMPLLLVVCAPSLGAFEESNPHSIWGKYPQLFESASVCFLFVCFMLSFFGWVCCSFCLVFLLSTLLMLYFEMKIQVSRFVVFLQHNMYLYCTLEIVMSSSKVKFCSWNVRGLR